MMYCPACGKKYETGKFCLDDGTKLVEEAKQSAPAEKTKCVCPKCGAILPVGSKFCDKCGAPITQAEEKAVEDETGESDPDYKKGEEANDKEDYETAIKYYKKALERNENNASALDALGVCYYLGDGVEEDDDKAKEYFEKAAELGNSDSQNRLGIIADKEEDYKTAVKWYKKAIETDENNANALYNLGECYKNGNGVGKDVAKSNELLKKAMMLGNNDAVKQLGVNALLNEKHELAKKYFEKALKNDDEDVEALYFLGLCMENDEDYDKAQEYFEKAADLGDSNSQRELGNLAFRNNNYETAVRFFREAIDTDEDNAEALFGLGYCYRYGKGVTENEDRAVNYFHRAADLGSQNAQDALDHKPGFLEKLSNIVDEKIADLLS